MRLESPLRLDKRSIIMYNGFKGSLCAGDYVPKRQNAIILLEKPQMEDTVLNRIKELYQLAISKNQ